MDVLGLCWGAYAYCIIGLAFSIWAVSLLRDFFFFSFHGQWQIVRWALLSLQWVFYQTVGIQFINELLGGCIV